jgi:lipopolysaccharide export system permease protein
VRILSRYVFFEVLVFFAISLSAFTGLLLTVRMLRLTSLIINRGVGVLQILQVFISIIPTFLEIALPMATLLGVILAFSRMCGDSEMVVMRASGISLYRFLRPVGVFALSVGALSLVVSIVLRPWGFKSLSTALFEVARSKSTSGLSEGIFNKLGAITLYAERIDYLTGDLSHVLVDDKRPDQPRKIVVAKKGRIIADEAAQSIFLLLGDGVAHELVEGKYTRTDFTSNSLSVDPNELLRGDSKRGLVSRELSTPELSAAIQSLKETIRSAPLDQELIPFWGDEVSRKDLLKKFRRAKIELGQRYSLPYASFIMAFIGMALGIMAPRTQRTWGAGVSAVLGLIVFVVYYSLFSMGIALADGGNVHVGVALWFPNFITTLIAVGILYKLGSEQWSSVPEGIQNAVQRVRALFKKVPEKRE